MTPFVRKPGPMSLNDPGGVAGDPHIFVVRHLPMISPSTFRRRLRPRNCGISTIPAQKLSMEFLGHFRRLTSAQRNTFIACFLGWSLDAFDFFILIFCVSAIATEFHAKVSAIAQAVFLTLAMRPIGAFLFGVMADRFGPVRH